MENLKGAFRSTPAPGACYSPLSLRWRRENTQVAPRHCVTLHYVQGTYRSIQALCFAQFLNIFLK